MPKVLFLAMHRLDRNPSQRYRFEQYLNYFKQQGWECELSNYINEKQDYFLYQKGNIWKKARIVCRGFLQRLNDVKRAKQFDIVFIHREVFLLGTTFFERKLKRSGAKLIFDFDDSIWLLDTSAGNQKWKFLKNEHKTANIIRLSDAVIAGNAFLASYARAYNQHVTIIPSTVDTAKYMPSLHDKSSETVTIGWSGSPTTVKHFETILPALEQIKEKYGERVRFALMGDGSYHHTKLKINGIAWNSDTEVNELSNFDIGIMPLPNDEWVKGKCGLKGLCYMALEIPTVLSSVGVNTEIIQDGENGFLAATEAEWVEKLSLLIDSQALRKKLGKAGRKTVVENYSVEANKEKYLHIFSSLLK